MNCKKAGLICGNPACGLRYRECIEVTRVLDGCLSRIMDTQFVVQLVNPLGTPPLTFLKAVSNGPTTISNLDISAQSGEKRRIDYDSSVPLTITYSDNLGVVYQAQSAVTFHREVFLNVPDDSVVPSTINVSTSIVSTSGSIDANNQVTFRCCTLQISKVCATVDLLVPTYGYCEFPSCDDADTCEMFFNMPLFPPLA